MIFPPGVSIPGIFSSRTSTRCPTYVKENASVNASRKFQPKEPCPGSRAESSSASGTASSVLRVRAFMQAHLQPVEDCAPPDAAVTRPQPPVALLGEGEGLTGHNPPPRPRARPISFLQI